MKKMIIYRTNENPDKENFHKFCNIYILAKKLWVLKSFKRIDKLTSI